MSNLRKLQLNENNFGDAGAADLMGSLVGLASLTYININENELSEDARDTLEAALKGPSRIIYV